MVFSGENAPVVNWFFLVFFGAAVVAFVTPRPLPKMFRFRLKRKKKAAQEEQAQLVSNEPASSERERKDGGHWKATPRQDWTQEGWDVKLQIWWRVCNVCTHRYYDKSYNFGTRARAHPVITTRAYHAYHVYPVTRPRVYDWSHVRS